MAEEPQGFFSRWARRKQEVREGRPVPEPPPPAAAPVPAAAPAQAATRGAETRAAPVPAQEPAAPPPTLDDVARLTPQSDFSRYMQGDVDPQVKNAAMRKLFADPHFNVMDGMDVYIDDYNKPDPMPASMLRKLASAQFLKLFDDEKKDPAAAPTVAAAPVSPADAAPVTDAAPPAPIAHDHDDTHLRLQQDHAAGPQGSGRGPQ
jgi:hypothetical protein